MIQKVIKLLNIRKQYLNKIVNRLLCGDIMSDELKITIYKWLINSEWHIHNELISIRNDFDRRSFHICKIVITYSGQSNGIMILKLFLVI